MLRLQADPPLEHPGQVLIAAFCPDGGTLLTAGAFPTVRLWDGASGDPVSPPLRHQAGVTAAVFSPAGKEVLVGTQGFGERWEGELALWKVPATLNGSVERLVLWAQVTTGMELSRRGELRPSSGEVWQKRREKLQELGGPPE